MHLPFSATVKGIFPNRFQQEDKISNKKLKRLRTKSKTLCIMLKLNPSSSETQHFFLAMMMNEDNENEE
jgi:hypothetical protein